MKIISILILLCVNGFVFANDGHCDIREDNKREWDVANMRISYSLGATIQDIMEEYPEYTYDEIYFIVEDPEGK